MDTNEQPAPYGAGSPSPAHSGAPGPKRVRVHHLQQLKDRGEKFAMLTAYDHFSAKIFEAAGLPILLVGDSAANTVLGYDTTLPLTMDEFLPLVRAVTRSVTRPLIVADLPFGTYQLSAEQAVTTSIRMMKEGGAHAVKLEGGAAVVPAVRGIVAAGIPVMAHIGFTPQAEHALGGYRVQGRGDDAEQLLQDALALQEAGAFAIVMEMVPAALAGEVTKALTIPTIGIGAGAECDAQVLVWQDMAGLNGGRTARFVKKYADLHGELLRAASEYMEEVRSGAFPTAEHSFE